MCINRAIEMNPTAINIVKAESADDYQLYLTIDDGKEQVVDFKPFLTRAQYPDIRSYLEPLSRRCYDTLKSHLIEMAF